MARLIAAGLMAWCFIAIHSPLDGGEPSQAFLKALRSHEYYDVALDYLNAMRTSPLADKAFQETIDFEIGATLEESARKLPLKEREEQLDKAAKH